jgi:hypothetical protein
VLLELARPVSLMLSIFSLYGVFYAAFLMPETSMEQRIWLSLELLSVSAGICLVTGLLFREPLPEPDDAVEREWRSWRRQWSEREGWPDQRLEPRRDPEPLLTTLPVRLFCWATLLMSALFVLAWYLETYYMPYRHLPPM